MADINSTLGHPSQVSLIAVADVTNLLGGKRKVEWDASTDTTGKEAAVIVASQLVNDLTFSGWAIFHYPQPFALPRTATNCYDVIAAESGSSTTAIYSTYLKTCNRVDWVGGSVHISTESDVDYGKAAKISAYDRAAGKLTIAGDFTVSPVNKSLVLISPLFIDVRRALAIQAHELMLKKDHHADADSAHRGLQSEWGDKGVSIQWVGPRALWHVEAYSLIKKYLSKSVRACRT